jgi:transposase
MAANGHAVLRSPPYNLDLNPIELIWADVKQWVGADNTTFRTNDAKLLCEQRFEETGEDKREGITEED